MESTRAAVWGLTVTLMVKRHQDLTSLEAAQVKVEVDVEVDVEVEAQSTTHRPSRHSSIAASAGYLDREQKDNILRRCAE